MTARLRRAGGRPTQDHGKASSIRVIPDGRIDFPRIVARVIVSLCALLWVPGLLSVVYAGLTERGRISDCHQTQAHQQNGPGHCASHCHALDSQAVDVRNRFSIVAAEGLRSEGLPAVFNVRHLYHGVVSRGPPAASDQSRALVIVSQRFCSLR